MREMDTITLVTGKEPLTNYTRIYLNDQLIIMESSNLVILRNTKKNHKNPRCVAKVFMVEKIDR